MQDHHRFPIIRWPELWAILALFAALWFIPGCPPADSDDDDAVADDDDAGDDDSGDDDDAGDDDTDYNIGPSGDFSEQMSVDGVSRSYNLYVPPSATTAMESEPVPVIIGLHGAGDTGSNFIQATGLTDTADSMGFVLIGPEGFNNGWFVQGDEGWNSPDGNSTSIENDMELLLMLLDMVAEDYRVNPRQFYVLGFSRGAGMTGLLASLQGMVEPASGVWESPFAAYGICAGYDAAGGAIDLGDASPKRPIWIIHGSSDNNVPYSYGQDFAEDLEDAGWDVTWTSVSGAGHSWLWRSSYGQTNEDLVNYFLDNELP